MTDQAIAQAILGVSFLGLFIGLAMMFWWQPSAPEAGVKP